MPVIANRNTTQTPVASGLTGKQVVKFVAADRIYVKAVDTTPAPPTTKSNGSTPAGWTDLGTMEGKARISYTKELAEIRRGIDNILETSYVRQKSATWEFSLTQLDDNVVKELSGVTPATITSGSIVRFAIGVEDVVNKAILIVSQNKIDGKEIQYYNPNAQIALNIEENGELNVVRVVATLPAFTYSAEEQLFSMTIFPVN